MLETFAASVHFKVLLHQHQYMPLMKKYCSFLNIASRDKSRDPFASALLEPDTSQPSASGVSGEPLSHQALAVLASYNVEHSPNQPLPSYISYSEHSIGKVTFTTYVSSTCNCNITFISKQHSTGWYHMLHHHGGAITTRYLLHCRAVCTSTI